MSKRRDPNRDWTSQDYAYRKARKRFRAACEKADVPCHLCGDRIDYSLEDGKDPNAFECDHFHPVSTHPHLAYDPANYHAAHLDCNRSRGNRDVRPTLGVPSEEW
ncbi:HNH endonuclease [Gordonia amarae]|uniref:HNH endonuclease n=1 Tax=Gordonia amarae TaxID=36821 RepID=UPI001AFBCD5F|nr:HNH endonuclease [Gordonia amarae]QHN17864.1 HNH endonuclease [Gordonia amarae]